MSPRERMLATLDCLEFPGMNSSADAYLQVFRAIGAAGHRVVLEGPDGLGVAGQVRRGRFRGAV